MNVVVRGREWLGARDSYLGGYVRTKALERVLAVTFAAAYHLTRPLAVMIFPTVFLRFCASFAYIPAMFLPWRYTLIVPAIVFLTTPYEPIAPPIAVFVGLQVAYFGSRLLGKYKLASLVAATFTTNFLLIFIRANIIGLYPFNMAIGPGMLKATLLSVVMLIFAPMMLKILESKKIISFKEQ